MGLTGSQWSSRHRTRGKLLTVRIQNSAQDRCPTASPCFIGEQQYRQYDSHARSRRHWTPTKEQGRRWASGALDFAAGFLLLFRPSSAEDP